MILYLYANNFMKTCKVTFPFHSFLHLKGPSFLIYYEFNMNTNDISILEWESVKLLQQQLE